MNYRHAFHAGNFADCMKHALLVALLRSLQRKPAPLFVLDTHAGTGHYDLESEPARRTGEAAAGIARLLHDTPAPLADYVALVRQLGLPFRLEAVYTSELPELTEAAISSSSRGLLPVVNIAGQLILKLTHHIFLINSHKNIAATLQVEAKC